MSHFPLLFSKVREIVDESEKKNGIGTEGVVEHLEKQEYISKEGRLLFQKNINR